MLDGQFFRGNVDFVDYHIIAGRFEYAGDIRNRLVKNLIGSAAAYVQIKIQKIDYEILRFRLLFRTAASGTGAATVFSCQP